MIEIKNLKKTFKKNKVISDVSFNIEEGKITGLIGDNGSGKTTIMKIISGLYQFDKGQIVNLPYINNELDICVLIENPTFNPFMNVIEILKSNISLDVETREDFRYYIDLFSINFLDKTFINLSLGMKQKVSLVYMFLKKAKLILLDEITNGLDERTISIFYAELKKYVKKHNAYVLISTHKIYELQPICNTVYFLSDGNISLKVDMDKLEYKQKQFVFNDVKSASDFMKEISNNISCSNENIVIIKYQNQQELKNILEIAFKYEIDEIKNDVTNLENLYFK